MSLHKSIPKAAAGTSSPGCADLLHTIVPHRDFLEMLPVAICACDARGRILWHNRRAVALWGQEPRLSDDAGRVCGSPMRRALATGNAVRDTETIVRPDGTRRSVVVQTEPVRDANGDVAGAIACLHDVTDDRRTEEEFERRRHDLEDFFENGAVALHLVGRDGTILRANRAELDLLGYSEEDYVGRKIWEFHADADAIADILARLARGEQLDRYPAQLRARDGSIRHVLITSNAQFRDGKLSNTRCFTVDVTDRKRAEARQRVLLDELNHRVKNNMQMLQALLLSAQRATTSSEARGVLADAGRRVGAMAAAQQVMYEAHDPAGFDAGDFLEAVCNTARDATDRGTPVHCEAAAGRLSNNVAMPLALILNELLANAVKHGRGAVHVELRHEDGEWNLSVHDNGPGFELDAACRRASGLGLVMGLTRQLGGSFMVERRTGAYCAVRFES